MVVERCSLRASAVCDRFLLLLFGQRIRLKLRLMSSYCSIPPHPSRRVSIYEIEGSGDGVLAACCLGFLEESRHRDALIFFAVYENLSPRFELRRPFSGQKSTIRLSLSTEQLRLC